MKTIKIISALVLLLSILTFQNMTANAQSANPALTGAWQIKEGNKEHVLVIQNGFFFHTLFNKIDKEFMFSQGGTYSLKDKQITGKIYFNTKNKEEVGTELTVEFSINDNNLTLEISGDSQNWTRLDDGSAPLAGIWRITARMQDGKIVPIHQTGARQTYKILSGTRFQWAAINPETKEFSGTGGGNYTFTNGKYTENIEFFSKDNSRVGASLSFDGKIENGEWHHSGLSSKGDKIYEIWSRVK